MILSTDVWAAAATVSGLSPDLIRAWMSRGRRTLSMGISSWAERSSTGMDQPTSAEHPVEVAVAEGAVRVDPVADGEEVVPPGVVRRQVGGRPGVQLAPVRATAVRAQHALDAGEVRAVVDAGADVEGEVDRVPVVGRGQPGLVRGRGAHLDRERDLPARLLDQSADLAQR